MSETSFHEKLNSHVGGLVRVRCDDGYANSLNGKIGLLMSASEGRRSAIRDCGAPMQIEVLIDGSVRILLLYPQELEFIGADDA
jgi:hypothetical protein